MTMRKDGSTTFKKFAYYQYIPNCSLYKGFWIIRIQVSNSNSRIRWISNNSKLYN